MMINLSVVIPIHNEIEILERNIIQLVNFDSLKNFRSVDILLVENGSTDGSKNIVKELNLPQDMVSDLSIKLHKLYSEKKGLGLAYNEAINYIIKMVNADWILFSAADLPFNDSDIKNFIKQKIDSKKIYLGSKSHPDSVVNRRFIRIFLSSAFRKIRSLILNLNYGDTQGSLFIHMDLIKEIYNKVENRTFFYNTELLYWAHKYGYIAEEIPVVFAGEKRKSKVPLIKESFSMLLSLLKIRLKYGGL